MASYWTFWSHDYDRFSKLGEIGRPIGVVKITSSSTEIVAQCGQVAVVSTPRQVNLKEKICSSPPHRGQLSISSDIIATPLNNHPG
jgi:hypothetical protein